MKKLYELEDLLAQRKVERITVKLGDIDIAEDASEMLFGGGSVLLDEQTTMLLARYLKVPGKYLKDCPADFRARTLSYWRDRHSEADTVIELVDGSPVSIHAPDLAILPVERVPRMLRAVFDPDADIHTLISDEKTFHVDVTSRAFSITVPFDEPSVAEDVIHGGVRVLVHPNQVKAPVVATYLHNSANNAGVVSDLKGGQISLRARSLDEVVDEMECAADQIRIALDDQLAELASTAVVAVPGTPLAFALQLAREINLPVKVRDEVTDLVNQLPSDASVYHVIQAFATVAGRSVKYSTRLALEQLAGRMSFDTVRVIERCTQCEQLLVAS